MTALQDFVATTSAVFGDAVDAEALWSQVSKMNPGPEAVHAPGVAFAPTRRKRKQVVTKRRELTPQERRARTEQNVARASNAVGLTAGGAAIGTTLRDPRLAEGGKVSRALYRAGEKMPKPIERATRKIGPKGAAALAGGAFALQAGNVVGDVVTARVLGRKDKVAKASLGALVRGWRKTSQMQAQAVMPKPATSAGRTATSADPVQNARYQRKAAAGTAASTQRKAGAMATRSISQATQAPTVVQRAGGDVSGRVAQLRASQQARLSANAAAKPTPAQSWTQRGQGAKTDFNNMLGTTSGKVALGGLGATAGIGMLKRRNSNSGSYDPYAGFGKSDVYEAKVGFSKFDEDKRLAFGWASIVTKNGMPVVDRQGDYIAIDDLEDAAYVYVEKSRVGGHMHRRAVGKNDEDDRPHHVADMVESMVFTPEKISKMGLPEDFPTGWWVGYRVFDDDAWSLAKEGKLTGFSVHGKGVRKSVDYDELMGAGR